MFLAVYCPRSLSCTTYTLLIPRRMFLLVIQVFYEIYTRDRQNHPLDGEVNFQGQWEQFESKNGERLGLQPKI